MLLPGGFQKFAGIPIGISRIFESLMVQQISANRRKNRSIQVKEIKSKRQARVYLVTLIKYLMSSAGNLKKEEIEAPVSRVFSEGGEIMATIAEQLIDQGIDKGIDKGKWDMVMKMLEEGISIDIISKVSGFTADQIREFEKKIQYQQENAAA